MQRFIALIILLIPGVIAGIGIKFMRDTVFHMLYFPSAILQFTIGLILFFAGLAFIGGFIFHRDRKRGKVAPRFNKPKSK